MLNQGTTSGEGPMMTLTLNTGQPMSASRLLCTLAVEPTAANEARRLARGHVDGHRPVDDEDVVVEAIHQAGGEVPLRDGAEASETSWRLALVTELTRNWGWTHIPGGQAVCALNCTKLDGRAGAEPRPAERC